MNSKASMPLENPHLPRSSKRAAEPGEERFRLSTPKWGPLPFPARPHFSRELMKRMEIKGIEPPLSPCTADWATSATSTWKTWPSIKWTQTDVRQCERMPHCQRSQRQRQQSMCHQFYRCDACHWNSCGYRRTFERVQDGPTSLSSGMTFQKIERYGKRFHICFLPCWCPLWRIWTDHGR